MFVKTPSMMLLGILATLGPAAAVVLGMDGRAHHAESHTNHSNNLTFDGFIEMHGREYEKGSDEYAKRAELFRAHVEAVEKHNSDPDRLWQAKITHLADRTAAELAKLRGYRRGAGSTGQAGDIGASQASFLSTGSHTVDVGKAPSDWSWVGRLKAMSNVRDQGECGSCWAFATSTVLRAHSELYQQDRTFSVQQILSCTPNPNHCGGDGGCQGATAELAMEYVSKTALLSDEALEYSGKDQKCPRDSQVKKANFISVLRDSLHLGGHQLHSPATNFGMNSWRKLPENKYAALLMAVFEEGPVGISLSAGETWNHYDSGVMDSCERGAVVNHAVVLVGYGEVRDRRVKYWQIQNSWGPTWGERGHIRLRRRNGVEEDQYCGWDRQPEQGTGCKGGPPKVWVCGSCGILYDSVVPEFAKSTTGLAAQQRTPELTDDEPADDDMMEKAESMLQLSAILRPIGMPD